MEERDPRVNETVTGTSPTSPTTSRTTDESGDPGRTPGTAEGDRKTVEEDLKNKSKEQEDLISKRK